MGGKRGSSLDNIAKNLRKKILYEVPWRVGGRKKRGDNTYPQEGKGKSLFPGRSTGRCILSLFVKGQQNGKFPAKGEGT